MNITELKMQNVQICSRPFKSTKSIILEGHGTSCGHGCTLTNGLAAFARFFVKFDDFLVVKRSAICHAIRHMMI